MNPMFAAFAGGCAGLAIGLGAHNDKDGMLSALVLLIAALIVERVVAGFRP